MNSPKNNHSVPVPEIVTSDESVDNDGRYHYQKGSNIPKHLYVLPVLFLEFLALAITRAALPSLIIHTFGGQVYFIMGCAECIRGLLAFISCPLFGKISDIVGRKKCFFVTVLGTCAPVCTLAIMTMFADGTEKITAASGSKAISMSTGEVSYTFFEAPTQSRRVWIFVYLLALSGLFSSTFTLVFAYISDTVNKQSDRVSAYGLALATFGLSYTIGPMAGGYLAHSEISSTAATTLDGESFDEGYYKASESNTTQTFHASENQDVYLTVNTLGQQRVFTFSLILSILDLLYIYYMLPESLPPHIRKTGRRRWSKENFADTDSDEDDMLDDVRSRNSFTALQERIEQWTSSVLPQQWTPLDALRVFSGDPLLAEVGRIAFLYYTGLWAVISTMMFYATKRFHYGPERLGELMSAFGLCTMIAEAVLLRIVVPILGEKQTMRLGLLAFALQCAVLGLAYEGWQLFMCVALSMASNLVYPSLTSLVSANVSKDAVGEALGAINGVKALTEGIGPLVFGGLMTLSESSRLPGWPYLIASVFALLAYHRAMYLPGDGFHEDDYDLLRFGKNGSLNYLNEKFSGARSRQRREGRVHELYNWLTGGRGSRASETTNSAAVQNIFTGNDEDELEELLSDLGTNENDDSKTN